MVGIRGGERNVQSMAHGDNGAHSGSWKDKGKSGEVSSGTVEHSQLLEREE